MPWLRTQECADLPDTDSYCICDDGAVDVITPGTVEGQTQVFDCIPCGEYGVQVEETVCCNITGQIYE